MGSDMISTSSCNIRGWISSSPQDLFGFMMSISSFTISSVTCKPGISESVLLLSLGNVPSGSCV